MANIVRNVLDRSGRKVVKAVLVWNKIKTLIFIKCIPNCFVAYEPKCFCGMFNALLKTQSQNIFISTNSKSQIGLDKIISYLYMFRKADWL